MPIQPQFSSIQVKPQESQEAFLDNAFSSKVRTASATTTRAAITVTENAPG